MDTLIESYGKLGKRLVFIADGGTWIKNWIEDAFPEAVPILLLAMTRSQTNGLINKRNCCWKVK